eukprot:6174764-Pleurochrysis_carterae.AAC.1
MGGLPYAVAHLGLDAPVYATLPTVKMGTMASYDAYCALRRQVGRVPYTLNEVDAAFDRIVQLKYSQTVRLSGRAAGISVVPLAAGVGLGGAIWR